MFGLAKKRTKPEYVPTHNDEMVQNLENSDILKDEEIINAFRCTDRGQFMPIAFRSSAYKLTAVKITGDVAVHLSAPNIYAMAVMALNLQPGMSFLNVGSGTGYLNTICGHLLGYMSINHGIEIDAVLVGFAQECQRQLSVTENANICVPVFFQGNVFSHNFLCRYDRIYVGAAVTSCQRAYICRQLTVFGCCVLPCDDKFEKITRVAENQFMVEVLTRCLFTPVVEADPMPFHEVPPESCRKTVIGSFARELESKGCRADAAQIDVNSGFIFLTFDASKIPTLNDTITTEKQKHKNGQNHSNAIFMLQEELEQGRQQRVAILANLEALSRRLDILMLSQVNDQPGPPNSDNPTQNMASDSDDDNYNPDNQFD